MPHKLRMRKSESHPRMENQVLSETIVPVESSQQHATPGEIVPEEIVPFQVSREQAMIPEDSLEGQIVPVSTTAEEIVPGYCQGQVMNLLCLRFQH